MIDRTHLAQLLRGLARDIVDDRPQLAAHLKTLADSVEFPGDAAESGSIQLPTTAPTSEWARSTRHELEG